MDGCPTILADSWLVLKISLTKLDKMNSNGDFLPLTRTPQSWKHNFGGYFYVAALLHKQERWDGLINEAIDGSELGAAVKRRGIDLGLDAVLKRTDLL